MRSAPAMRADAQPAVLLEWLPLAAALAGIALVYHQTFSSLVSVWQESATFTHCFLIAPICLYLIWQQRAEVLRAPKRVSVKGMVVITLLTLGWLVATVAKIQVVQQTMVVLMIPAAVLALLGEDATRRIAFPLGFLLFAVPFGEWAIPPLMDFTADFAVAGLRLTGIPVLREGVYFSIPSGDFEVAKGCSGIRYLIACVAIGVLYAHLAYRSMLKRSIFVALSIVVPVVGNGIRAYLIVMIAHLSEMRLAVGIDHLIYGAIFFGLIVALMLWLGSLFQDPAQEPSAAPLAQADARRNHGLAKAFIGTFLIVGLAAGGPYTLGAVADAPQVRSFVPRLPVITGSWQGPRPAAQAGWRKADEPAAVAVRGAYGRTNPEVEVDVVTSGVNSGDWETVGSFIRMVDERRWQILGTHGALVEVDGASFAVQETQLKSRNDHVILWHWYVIGEVRAASDWRAKALEAWNRVIRRHSDSALVVLSARASEPSVARAALQRFLEESASGIARCLGVEISECTDAAEQLRPNL